MDNINIYIMTTNKTPRAIPTAGEYIIEVIHEGTLTTFPPQNKSTLLKEVTTGRVMVNKLLCNALFMLKKLSGIEYENIRVVIEPYTNAMPLLHKWLDKWQQDKWIDSKGNALDKTYITAYEWIQKSKPITFETGHHSYSDVMMRDLEKYSHIEMAYGGKT